MATVVRCAALDYLLDSCDDLGLHVSPSAVARSDERLSLQGPSGEPLSIDLQGSGFSMIEQVLRAALRFRRIAIAGEGRE